MPRKAKKDAELASSLNNHFVCDHCSKKFTHKRYLGSHLNHCKVTIPKRTTYSLEKWRESMTCTHCKIVYGNRKLLNRHMAIAHNQVSNASNDEKKDLPSDNIIKNVLPMGGMGQLMTCQGCSKVFPNMKKFRIHRRKEHFNLLAKIPYCDQKKVNQVWFEKVMNCNNIVEIHKTAPNTLVLRKLDENTAIKVYENNTKIIDLSDIYPTKLRKRIKS